MERFVIDASVGPAWVHPAHSKPETDALLKHLMQGAEISVPSHGFVEIANTLITLARRKRFMSDERAKALALLDSLKFTVDQDGRRFAFTKVSALAALRGLSAHAATCLKLALSE